MRTLSILLVLAVGLPAAAQQARTQTASRLQARGLARSAMQSLRRQASQLRVAWRADRVRPTMLRGFALTLPGKTLAARARAFIDRYPGLVARSSSELTLIGQRSSAGRRVLRFEQRLGGVVVDRSLLTMAFDDRNRLVAVHADTRPLPSLDTRPRISVPQAIAATWQVVSRRPARATERRRLRGLPAKLVVQALANQARLVYLVVLPLSLDIGGRQHMVDAHSGRYLGWRRGVVWHRRPTARPAGVRR